MRSAEVEKASGNSILHPLRVGRYEFKQADRADEFHQIHALNCRTFVHELGQHPDPDSDVLIDPFHHKSIYFIGKRSSRVVGMISLHSQPPYSGCWPSS